MSAVGKLHSVIAEVEKGIGESAQQNSSRASGEGGSEMAATNIGATLQRVAGTSAADINGLITELTEIRDRLQHDAQRLQREIQAYAQMSQAALHSIKSITECIAQFNRAAGQSRTH